MYLKELHITNFRCFNDYRIEFAPRVTVLFGKNGSGKSTLIHAIHKALSFMFYKEKNNKDSINLTSGFPELRVEKYNTTDAIRNIKTGVLFPFMSIEATATFLETNLTWELYAQTSKNEPYSSKYLNAFKTLMNKVSETNVFPFVAYYSDSFPHIPKAKSITREQYELRNIGYLDWNKESACSELWIERYKKTWEEWDRANRAISHEEKALNNCEVLLKNGVINTEEYKEDIQFHKQKLEWALKEKTKYDEEVNIIKACLIKFSKGDANYEITDIYSSIYKEEGLCFVTTQKSNHSQPFHTLPAGYKRMYYMVLDIAYRSYMLNKDANPSGVAIIDEIDLHLHPELEKDVLKRFMDTFPNLQFIVSTHSPLVLTGLETEGKPNRILQMNAETKAPKPVLWPDVYGLDYNTGLEDIMGVVSKNSDLDYMVSLCAYMRKRNKMPQADNIKQRILSTYSKNESELDKMIEKKISEM